MGHIRLGRTIATMVVALALGAGNVAVAAPAVEDDRGGSLEVVQPDLSQPSAEPSDEPGKEQRATPAAAAVAQSSVGVTKESNLDGSPITPGSELVYTITVRCSGLTVGCINHTTTDVLPVGLDVLSLPPSTATREVDYDAGTRELTVRFLEPLREPAGEVGLNDGATRSFDVGMRLPAATALLDGARITNTATTVADNADPASSTNELTVSVPREVRPVATKRWADGSAIAGSGEASTIDLGIRNASSSSARVAALRVDDVAPATWERFDLTDAALVSFPAGADRARLWVCTAAASACADDAAWTAGDPVSEAGPLPLPAGLSAAAVTGVRVVLTAASGDALPYDATGGSIRLGVVLRDTLRSSGASQSPTSKVTVTNEAVPGAVDTDGDLTRGAPVRTTYDVHPDTVVVRATKAFFADTDGDFTRENGEYAVLGQDSPVTATISLRNDSAFPLRQLRITEPDAGAPGVELAKLDLQTARLRMPQGGSEAVVTVSYADGSPDQVTTLSATGVVAIARPGTSVTAVSVVITGVEGGSPSIAVGSSTHLDLHGRLNAQVTTADLPDGASPGVHNCAAYRAQADISNSTGTTSGNACATLPVERVRSGGSGTKSVGQTTVPPGQPIPFTMTLSNNGNVPLVDPVLSDPPTEADGTPRSARNPFAVVRLVSARIRKDAGTPPARLEVFDPAAAAWVDYVASDSALLERATGVRVLLDGELATTRRVHLDLVTLRRDGVADGVTLANCFQAGAVGWSGDPACAAEVTTAPASSAAAVNKQIAPGTLPAPIAGVPRQTATTRITVANTGNVSARRLQVTDADAAFFDAVDFARISEVVFPPGADRVRFDALTDTGWVDGAPVASRASYALPAGVTAGDVRGLRATFSAASGDYAILPCEGAPTPTSCTGAVAFETHLRTTLRSDAESMPAGELRNTAAAGFETRLQNPGTVAPVDPVEATLRVVEGDPQLRVEKSPNSAIAPGENAPFRLEVTNTGTADLPALRVRDQLPAGLTFDETFADGAGFRMVDVKVPSGTEAPPVPTLHTEHADGRVSGLRWDFGDWVLRPGSTLALEISVRLAPGVTEGQVNTNLMGATSSAPRLSCAPGVGSQLDGPMGPGRWCTDTAVVTTKAGAAFEARKWVSGTAALGWWNNRAGRSVPTGDATCPSYSDGVRTYTAYPCVALVNPGDRYHYLMRFVNAGTEPATAMRVIDRFPVQGDKGVVLSNTDRGTQWDARPTLASPPSLTGPGTLTASYTHTESGLCTTDLTMTDRCGSAWSDPYGPEAVGMQLRVAWSTPLPPGDAVDIAFAMDSPLEVSQVADPTIAWNSFGHAETTRRANGSTRVLPPTEPIQVGVALAYGSLTVGKKLLANPGDLPLADQGFEIDYACTIEPVGHPVRIVASGTLTLRPDETRTLNGLPAGAVCKVWEEDPLGGITNHPVDDPAVVQIVPQLGSAPVSAAVVEVTNSYPLAEIEVAKVVTGAAASYGAATAYEVEVTCVMGGTTAAGFPVTVELVGNDRKKLQAPVGTTCAARETADGGATATTVTPASGLLVEPGASAAQVLEVTNTFEAGRLQILKRVSGVGAALPAGPFGYQVACTFEGTAIAPVDVTVVRPAGETELVADVPLVLPVGAECTVTETDDGGADATPAPVTVRIVQNADANTVRATFTNEFSAAGLAVTKTLAGAGAAQPYATDAVFTVAVTCAVGDPTNVLHSRELSIRGGQRLELTDGLGDPVLLPRDARCWAEETGTGGATSVAVNAGSWAEGLVVASASPHAVQQLELEVTNTYDLTSLELLKEVDGAAAAFAEGREFLVEVSCVLPQDGVRTPVLTAREVTLTAEDPVVLTDLAVGAECWAAETDAGGATASAVDFPAASSPLLLAAAEGRITVTNTFDAGQLLVRKRVVGDGSAGPYTFEVACTTDQGEVLLPAGDARFRLRHGETRRISVPLGAVCAVSEPDAPADAEVTFRDSDGDHDATVTVAPKASVTVVNTFPEDGEGPRDPGSQGAGGAGANLPDLGGPAGWLAVLALGLAAMGAVLVRSARRRTV